MATSNVYDAIDALVAKYNMPKGGAPVALAARVLIDQNGNVVLAADPNGVCIVSSQDALTAFAGGGQGSATKITSSIARFATVATAADSSVLPSAVAGMEITVVNSGAASMNVFPASGEKIDGGSTNAAVAIVNGKSATFYCTVAGQWFSLKSA